MKAIIRGIPVEGTPDEIEQLIRWFGEDDPPAVPARAPNPPKTPPGPAKETLPWAPMAPWCETTSVTVSAPHEGQILWHVH